MTDKKENRDVATLYLPNAFIQTSIRDEHVIMKLRGTVAELMVSVAPETHSDYVTCENGAPIFHVELLKSLNGLLKSSLKFYIKVVED